MYTKWPSDEHLFFFAWLKVNSINKMLHNMIDIFTLKAWPLATVVHQLWLFFSAEHQWCEHRVRLDSSGCGPVIRRFHPWSATALFGDFMAETGLCEDTAISDILLQTGLFHFPVIRWEPGAPMRRPSCISVLSSGSRGAWQSSHWQYELLILRKN